MVVCGLDLSLRKTGVVILRNPSVDIMDYVGEVIKTELKDGADEKIRRLVCIRDRIEELVRQYDVKIVGVEGQSWGGMGRIGDLGELAGTVKCRLYEMGCRIYVIPPTKARKAVTGKGGNKAQTRNILTKYFGLEFKDLDIMDAWVVGVATALVNGIIKPNDLLRYIKR